MSQTSLFSADICRFCFIRRRPPLSIPSPVGESRLRNMLVCAFGIILISERRPAQYIKLRCLKGKYMWSLHLSWDQGASFEKAEPGRRLLSMRSYHLLLATYVTYSVCCSSQPSAPLILSVLLLLISIVRWRDLNSA